MYKRIKKKTYEFLLVLILIFEVFQHSVCAEMPLKYQFKPWTGQEDTSVVVNGQGSNAVLKLVCNGKEIQKADYSVETKENDLLLTIREEYLETLDNGTYNMVLYFEPEPTLYEYGSEVSVGKKDYGISISGLDMTTFDKLVCGDEEILADSYLAITTEDSIRIEFKEEYKDYVEELNEKNKTFYMVFMNSELVWLNLVVDANISHENTDIIYILSYERVLYNGYFGCHQNISVENSDNEYMIIYLTDISETKIEEFKEDTNLPESDNIIFKQCKYSYKELAETAEKIGDDYSYKEIYKIVHNRGMKWTCTEAEYNSILNSTEIYNNKVEVYLKDMNYESNKGTFESKYEDKITCMTQNDYNYLNDLNLYVYSTDVNADGKCDLKDAQMILKGALNIMDFTYNEFVEGDINQDEKLTLEDANLALRRALKITE